MIENESLIGEKDRKNIKEFLEHDLNENKQQEQGQERIKSPLGPTLDCFLEGVKI